MKIGIAGAGLVGRLMAWRLALAGHEVTVCDPVPGPERGPLGAAAFTAAGLLTPLAELDRGEAVIAEMGWRSLALWRRWIDQMQEPVHFAQRGSLLLSHPGDRASAQRLLARIQVHAPGHPPRELGADELQAMEPALLRGLQAWHLAGEGQIHTVQAMDGLARAGSRAGVQWCWSRTVREVAPGRLDEQRFDHVIDARGVGARPQLPVRGVRGEVFWLHAPGVQLAHPLRLLHPRHKVYMLSRPDDIIVVGASEVESEDRSPVSLRSTLELLSAAHSAVPELAEARIVHTESNLRPALPDNLPLLEAASGLTRVNGLFRHGWLVAPALVESALAALQ